MPNSKTKNVDKFRSSLNGLHARFTNPVMAFRRNLSALKYIHDQTQHREMLLVCCALTFCKLARDNPDEYEKMCVNTGFVFRLDQNPDGQIARHLLQICSIENEIKPFFATCFASFVRHSVTHCLDAPAIERLLKDAGSVQNWYRFSEKNSTLGRPKSNETEVSDVVVVDADGKVHTDSKVTASTLDTSTLIPVIEQKEQPNSSSKNETFCVASTNHDEVQREVNQCTESIDEQQKVSSMQLITFQHPLFSIVPKPGAEPTTEEELLEIGTLAVNLSAVLAKHGLNVAPHMFLTFRKEFNTTSTCSDVSTTIRKVSTALQELSDLIGEEVIAILSAMLLREVKYSDDG